MKNGFWLLAFYLVVGILPSSVLAVDPSDFLTVLNFNVDKIKGDSKFFDRVQHKLGISQVINSGDASTGMTRIEYVLKNKMTMVSYYETECTSGCTIEEVDSKVIKNKTELKTKPNEIIVAGMHLGMDRREVDLLLPLNVIKGGWKVDVDPGLMRSRNYDFYKTIRGKSLDGGIQKFCYHIWINLTFKSDERLEKIEVSAGGCDDSACEGEPTPDKTPTFHDDIPLVKP